MNNKNIESSEFATTSAEKVNRTPYISGKTYITDNYVRSDVALQNTVIRYDNRRIYFEVSTPSSRKQAETAELNNYLKTLLAY